MWKFTKKTQSNQGTFLNLQLHLACQHHKMCALIRHTICEGLVEIQSFRNEWFSRPFFWVGRNTALCLKNTSQKGRFSGLIVSFRNFNVWYVIFFILFSLILLKVNENNLIRWNPAVYVISCYESVYCIKINLCKHLWLRQSSFFNVFFRHRSMFLHLGHVRII